MKQTARDRALAFAEFCYGMEDAGYADYARRGRSVADDLLQALDMLDAERSARRAIQERAERLQAMLCGPYSSLKRVS